MDPVDSPVEAWRPDRTWADPLIVLLTMVAILLSWIVLQRRSVPAPLFRVGIQGRVAELPFAAEKLLELKGHRRFISTTPEQLAATLTGPWDRALAGILAAERGDLVLGQKLAAAADLPGPAAAAFGRCWERAYEAGVDPHPGDRAQVQEALGNGWAAALLEARLTSRTPGNPGKPELEHRVQRRILVVALLALGGVVACLAGLGTGLALLMMKRKATLPVVPPPACCGRALLLVFLGWFLGLGLFGTLTAPVFRGLPFLQPYALPINYCLHAAWGIFLLRKALGSGWRDFARGLWPTGTLRSLAWGLGHLAMAVPLVLVLSLLASPLTRWFPPPQREMMEFLAGLRGVAPLLATVLTVSLLAPAFEELIFRGTILPFLAQRWGWTAAILASGLLFGAIHLQPAGLPTLTGLGVVMGAAFRSGGLLSAIIVHGLWNGTVLLFLLAIAS
jgi:membrane protease YdiL (CAAX protease family)